MKKIFTILFLICSSSSWAELLNFDGPNCINNALIETKLIKYHRYSSLSEIKILLASPLCKKLTSKDNLDFSIGLVHSESRYANPELISHAFIRLNNQIAQEKRGYSKSDPYHLVPLNQVFDDYSLEHPEKSVEYYRCNPFSEFFRHKGINKKIIQKLKEFDILEIELQSILSQINLNKISSKELEMAVTQLENHIKIFASSDQLRIHHYQSETDILLIKILASRVVSIAGQLNALNFKGLRENTSRFEYSLQDIADVFDAIQN